MFTHTNLEDYVSEADFVARFLLPELKKFSDDNGLELELHVEERINDGSADLTVRKGGREFLVIEAKLDTDPWHPEVVRQGFGYASNRFSFFATCNRYLMILFETGSDPFISALHSLRYEDSWVQRLFQTTSSPPVPKPLYQLLMDKGLMDSESKILYEDLIELQADSSHESYEDLGFRLLATSGPLDVKYPFDMGRYPELEGAKKNRSLFRQKGFQIKIQKKSQGRWLDFDADQTNLPL